MQQDTTPCNICGSKVLTKCLQVHHRACSRRLSKPQLSSSAIKSKMVDLIPCTECGEMVEFSVYSIHIQQCEGRQLTKCHQCKLLYPTFLIQQHLVVCNQFREEEPAAVYGVEVEQQNDPQLRELIMQMASKAKVSQQPLSVSVIQNMRKFTTNQSTQCSICCCQITRNNTLIRLNCPHKFHVRCLSAWLQKNPLCPMCRRHALA